MKSEEFVSRMTEIEGWQARITTYKIGDRYHCMIDNVDPGSRIARAQAATREDAESMAFADASRRLARTRRRGA